MDFRLPQGGLWVRKSRLQSEGLPRTAWSQLGSGRSGWWLVHMISFVGPVAVRTTGPDLKRCNGDQKNLLKNCSVHTVNQYVSRFLIVNQLVTIIDQLASSTSDFSQQVNKLGLMIVLFPSQPRTLNSTLPVQTRPKMRFQNHDR